MGQIQLDRLQNTCNKYEEHKKYFKRISLFKYISICLIPFNVIYCSLFAMEVPDNIFAVFTLFSLTLNPINLIYLYMNGEAVKKTKLLSLDIRNYSQGEVTTRVYERIKGDREYNSAMVNIIFENNLTVSDYRDENLKSINWLLQKNLEKRRKEKEIEDSKFENILAKYEGKQEENNKKEELKEELKETVVEIFS